MTSPYLITEPTIISFSGGRTSGYMLWKCLEAHGGKLPDEAVVCFANTGKEEEATLKFVNDCAVNWNVPIVWLEFRDNEKKFEVVTYETASRNGEPFEQLIDKKHYLPNQAQRFCTQELKVNTFTRYFKSIGIMDIVTFVGIRADEPRRIAKISQQEDKLMPLSKDGVTEKMVWDFWNNNTFDLELPKQSGSSNCDLCFLKGTAILTSLIQQKPERTIWWQKQEASIGARFSKDKPTYSQMAKFNREQTELFVDATIECFCGD
jgi:3'-phosphoadenosine 5'-phosphosulfate sulfotransferase (PAPS reductase)/FAD synthetase